jgi:hypothetical protein
MRILCTVGFKLNVIKYVEEHGNIAAKKHFDPSAVKTITCEWRGQEEELQKQAFCVHIGKTV